jgi:hypothetical protein
LNEEVLAYLETERVAPPGTNDTWVMDGYALATHPDLCERLREIGGPATYVFERGRPVLKSDHGLIVAFAAGTHILCIRVTNADPRLVVEDGPDLGPGWTRVDPWTVNVPREEGLELLAGLVRQAVEEAF